MTNKFLTTNIITACKITHYTDNNKLHLKLIYITLNILNVYNSGF